jgi:hypothetical protein
VSLGELQAFEIRCPDDGLDPSSTCLVRVLLRPDEKRSAYSPPTVRRQHPDDDDHPGVRARRPADGGASHWVVIQVRDLQVVLARPVAHLVIAELTRADDLVVYLFPVSQGRRIGDGPQPKAGDG